MNRDTCESSPERSPRHARGRIPDGECTPPSEGPGALIADRGPLQLGVIGYGAIARPVVDFIRSGRLPGWKLQAVLRRTQSTSSHDWMVSDADSFFSRRHDLIVEAAGPSALALHAVRAIQVSDIWSVSGAALCDDSLLAAITTAGASSGNRLRLVAGAIAGLDGLSAVSAILTPTDVHIGLSAPAQHDRFYEGTVREAAKLFPDSVNVAAAAALAGSGLDATRVALSEARSLPHELTMAARSSVGEVQTVFRPCADGAIHPVAASVIAALRQELNVVWVG